MQNSEPLVFLGIAILAVTAFVILVPFLRRTADILTAWNLVLLGVAMFMGIGSLSVVYGNFHWPELQWFQPSRSDVQKFIVGSIVFFAALLISYYVLKLPRKISVRFLNSWPPMSPQLVYFSLALFTGIAIAASLTKGVVFFGSLFSNISHKALVFAVVFSFCHWYHNRRQLPLLLLFLAVYVLAAFDSMVVFRGRRLLLSVAVAPFICMYWLNWRYLSPRKNLFRLGIVTALAFSAAVVYTSFRHYDKGGSGAVDRNFAMTLQAMRNADVSESFKSVSQNMSFYISQYCVHYSLLTIHLVDGGQIEVQPLNTLKFLATYPIPRAIWPNKPQSLGIRIVVEILRLPYHTNWGLGIVANSYQEGGLWVVVLYAFLIVVCVRLLDDALVRQPNNVFLLGILCAAAPHYLTLIRGDPTSLAAEIMESFAFAWLLGFGLRLFFGTAAASQPYQTATVCRR